MKKKDGWSAGKKYIIPMTVFGGRHSIKSNPVTYEIYKVIGDTIQLKVTGDKKPKKINKKVN